MTPPIRPLSPASPLIDLNAPTRTAPRRSRRRSRGEASFWLWAVAAPIGAVLMATHHWWGF